MTDARVLMYRWANADKFCARANEEISEYQTLLDGARDLTGLAMDGMPHGSTVGNPTESKAMRVLELEEQYTGHIEYLCTQVAEALALKRTIDGVLNTFPPQYLRMATLRYKYGYSWLKVSLQMYLSEQRVRQMDADLVDRVAKTSVF